MTVDRRTALSLLGSSIGLATLAGCSETSDDSSPTAGDEETDETNDTQETTVSLDRTLPSYAAILPETEGTGYFYGAIDVETMASLLEDEDVEAGEEPTDPLLGNPIVVALYCAYAIELVGGSPSFEAFNSNNETADDETAETFLFADGVYAFAGTYDVEGFAAAIEERDAYTEEASAAASAVYVHDESGEVVGISDDVYALSYPNESDDAFDPVATVERTVATAAGDRDPKHETDDGFERLLRAGASDGITLGLATTDEEFARDTLENAADDTDGLTFAFDAFEGAQGVHQQLSVAGDDATARAIVTYANADRVAIDRLESALGTEADTVETATAHDGTAAVVDAEYTADLVDE